MDSAGRPASPDLETRRRVGDVPAVAVVGSSSLPPLAHPFTLIIHSLIITIFLHTTWSNVEGSDLAQKSSASSNCRLYPLLAFLTPSALTPITSYVPLGMCLRLPTIKPATTFPDRTKCVIFMLPPTSPFGHIGYCTLHATWHQFFSTLASRYCLIMLKRSFLGCLDSCGHSNVGLKRSFREWRALCSTKWLPLDPSKRVLRALPY